MLLLLAYLDLLHMASSGVIHLNRGASTTIINEQIFIVLHCEDICKQKVRTYLCFSDVHNLLLVATAGRNYKAG